MFATCQKVLPRKTIVTMEKPNLILPRRFKVRPLQPHLMQIQNICKPLDLLHSLLPPLRHGVEVHARHASKGDKSIRRKGAYPEDCHHGYERATQIVHTRCCQLPWLPATTAATQSLSPIAHSNAPGITWTWPGAKDSAKHFDENSTLAKDLLGGRTSQLTSCLHIPCRWQGVRNLVPPSLGCWHNAHCVENRVHGICSFIWPWKAARLMVGANVHTILPAS